MLALNLCRGSRCLALALLIMSVSLGYAAPIISEFMAENSAGLADEDGQYSDWIEIHNPEDTTLSLAGYRLTDDPVNLAKWTFPNVSLAPSGYLVIFASGKNRTDPTGRLHTNFKLAAEGGYLGLVAPDGSVVSGFAPKYPPQFENVSFGLAGSPPVWSFFSTPTPGAANGSGTRAGPIISVADKNPAQPVTGPVTLTAAVVPVNGPVASVTLYYRHMYGVETTVAMADDGTGEDVVAGDGIWTAVIPASAFVPGEMTRWRFAAKDQQGTATQEPAFRLPLDSPQYFGTVAPDPRIRTALPVVHWFTSNPAGATTTTGSRGSVYWDGEFYDNVFFYVHGQSSAGFPKHSYNVKFNHGADFLWSTNAPRVKAIDLLSNWADKSKVRDVLAYELMRRAGVAAHFAFTVRVQQNGTFFSTADFVEHGDEIFLERAGLNKDGALYKIYNNALDKSAGDTGTTGVEKKTRKFENNSDLQALINGVSLTGQALTTYLYDNIDIPACVNLLAVNSVIRNIDMHRKNWYAYRDTGRSGEWAILPWDLDLSYGRVWDTQYTYFDSGIYTDGYVFNSTAIKLVAEMSGNPAMGAMILRRIRTLTDQFLQPPPAAGTPESQLFFERRLNEQSALIDPPDIVPSDARQDFEKWGSWLQGGATVRYTNTNPAVETMARAIQRWKTEYLPVRRQYIYNTQIAGKGGEIPLAQTNAPAYRDTPLVNAGAPAQVLVPTNGALGTTWTGDPRSEPFAATDWIQGATGVGYDRGAGYGALISTDINGAIRAQSNNTVYIRIEFNVPNPTVFDRLELRMKCDDGFIAFLNGMVLAAANTPVSPTWNSAAKAQHKANLTTFDVYDVTSKKGYLQPGRNVLAIQGLNDSVSSPGMLIVPELHGQILTTGTGTQPVINFGKIEATPASGNQDQEYVQLLNSNSFAVDISDWRLIGAVEHTFRGGTVLPANGALYLCPDAAAFRARTVSPKGGEGLFVQGGYQGHLSALGETLTLLDSSGATNNTTTYPAQPSDAQQYLVISQIMFHPAGDGLAEFIELLNISTSVTLDLRGVHFTHGVDFDFTGSAVTSLPPGGRVLVVRDLQAFQAAYGSSLPVAGVFANGSALSNGGEKIQLDDARNEKIEDFSYLDQPPWPALGGVGYSLVLIAPETHPDPSSPMSWRASVQPGGSPGRPDMPAFPADPLADTDANGEPDLIDYALGNDLGLPPILPKLALGADALGGEMTLQLSYPVSVNAQNVTVGIAYSTDLKNWQDATSQLETIATEPLGDGRNLITVRIKPPLRDQPRVFVRLSSWTSASGKN